MQRPRVSCFGSLHPTCISILALAQPPAPCMLLAIDHRMAGGSVGDPTSALSALPPAGLRQWKQTPTSARHLCLPHWHLPGEAFQGHSYSQALPHAPTIVLSHPFVHATCSVSTYCMPDTVLGTGEPPQKSGAESAGWTDK